MKNATRLEEINADIAALEAEKATLEATQAGPWPKRTTIYLHGSKESNYNHGQTLGLSDTACETFMYACYEVGIDLEVTRDGKATIIGVNGTPLHQGALDAHVASAL